MSHFCPRGKRKIDRRARFHSTTAPEKEANSRSSRPERESAPESAAGSWNEVAPCPWSTRKLPYGRRSAGPLIAEGHALNAWPWLFAGVIRTTVVVPSDQFDPGLKAAPFCPLFRGLEGPCSLRNRRLQLSHQRSVQE